MGICFFGPRTCIVHLLHFCVLHKQTHFFFNFAHACWANISSPIQEQSKHLLFSIWIRIGMGKVRLADVFLIFFSRWTAVSSFFSTPAVCRHWELDTMAIFFFTFAKVGAWSWLRVGFEKEFSGKFWGVRKIFPSTENFPAGHRQVQIAYFLPTCKVGNSFFLPCPHVTFSGFLTVWHLIFMWSWPMSPRCICPGGTVQSLKPLPAFLARRGGQWYVSTWSIIPIPSQRTGQLFMGTTMVFLLNLQGIK